MSMKKTKQHIILLLAVLLTVGLSSCIKEDYAGSSNDTATVNLVFDTRANGDATAPVDENEGIKTLRVYITDEQGNVEFNIYQEYTDDQAQRTLTILGVPVGTKNFYVIANEASVGLEKEVLDARKEVDASFLNTVIINSPGNAYFPQMSEEISTSGLPITGIKEKVNISSEKEIEIFITHAVAKFVLYVKNVSGEEFTINSVNFGRFIADRTVLFPGQGTAEGITYDGWNASCNVTVPADADGTQPLFTGYFYETDELNADAFTLALQSDTQGYDALATPAQICFTDEGRNYIHRNEQVEITATVDVKEQSVPMILDCIITPWTEHEVNVPPFN